MKVGMLRISWVGECWVFFFKYIAYLTKTKQYKNGYMPLAFLENSK